MNTQKFSEKRFADIKEYINDKFNPKLKGWIPSLFLLSLFCCIFAISGWIVYQEYKIDWDVLRYVINVKIRHVGDGRFSYAHNLLKTYIFFTANIIRFFTGGFEPLSAAKILTITLSAVSSFFLFMIIQTTTNRRYLGIIASMLWFLIPVNFYHMAVLEDNIWANAFNTLAIYLMILIYGFSGSCLKISIFRLYFLVVLCGLSISIGINFHQQIVPLFYLFLIAPFFSCRRKITEILAIIFTFVTSYFGFSFIQNYLSFGRVEIVHTVKRLIHQAYAGIFPHLWFFSSDSSLSQWILKIFDGLKKSFFIGGEVIPALFILLVPISLFTCLFLLIKQFKKTDKTDIDDNLSRSNRLVLFLIIATFMHVPHTLVYEPWNPERWDVITPAMIALMLVSLHLFISETKHQLQKRNYRIADRIPGLIHIFAVVLLLITMVQTYRHFNDYMIYQFKNSRANIAFSSVFRHLEKTKKLSKNDILLLDPIMGWYFEERITYDFPVVYVIRLNKTLDIKYSSSEQQYWNKPYPMTHFPKNKFSLENRFHIMPYIWRRLKKKNPEFLEDHSVQLISLD